jgi:hypothetical protein
MIGSRGMLYQTFNPRNVGGLVLWLDATDPAANGVQPANNAAIASWVDKSTAANTVSQGTGANQPTYKTNIINSKPVVRFNGSTTSLVKTTVTSLGSTATVFVVGTINDNGFSAGTFLEYSNAGTVNTGCLVLYESALLKWRVVVATVIADATYSTSLPYSAVTTAYNNGSNSFLLVNGTQQATAVTGNMDATSRLTLGSLVSGIAGYFLNGDIAEVIVYNSSISSAERTLVSRYLGNKWGFTVA